MVVTQLQPVWKPQDKGKIKAEVKYVRNNFLKTINHTDFYRLINDLKEGNENICNKRIHGTTKRVPYEMFIENEKPALTSLPDSRYEIYEISQWKVNNYGHITFEHNYYSVPYEYTGQKLIVKNNGNILKIFKDNKQVVLHCINHGKGNFITC